MDIDGRAVAKRVADQTAPEVDALLASGRRPRLVAIQVGNDAATEAFVRGQSRAAAAWRIDYETRLLAADVSEADVRAAIDAQNRDPAVTGVLLQMPLPKHLPSRALQQAILPSKDVEGVHPENVGNVLYGRDDLAPCTARAAIELIESTGVEVEGAEAVVVGHSEIVGKPVALMLLARNATTHVCHKFTADLAAQTRRADILVVAVGKPGLIRADMVKETAVVIDVGINEVPVANQPGKTRLVGDVDYEGLSALGCRVTPVPGGVGPVTVAILMRNAVRAARRGL